MAKIYTYITNDGKIGCSHTSSIVANSNVEISSLQNLVRGSFFKINPIPPSGKAGRFSIPNNYRLPGDSNGFTSYDGYGNVFVISKGPLPMGVVLDFGIDGGVIKYRLWAAYYVNNYWIINPFNRAPLYLFQNPDIVHEYNFTYIADRYGETGETILLSYYALITGKEYLCAESGGIYGDAIEKYYKKGEIDPDAPQNPYEPGGESGEGGGDGNFDDTSDPIPDSSLPTLSSSNTGFTRIYNPSLSQVQDLARYLWTDESIIQTIWNHIRQFMENPMDAIIGFNLVPCTVPNGGTKEFALMYIGTGVQMTVAANQFVDVDCGTCELAEYFGSALDYAPYTKISCFLPYIGTVELNVDEVMKTTLQVKYRIDICSGSCVAKIFVNGNVLYQYSGHCAISIPISAADFSSYVSAAISVAKLAIGAAVGGGMGAASALAADPSQQTNQIVTTTQTTETARNPATGRQITMGTRTTVETRESPADQSSTQASFSGLTPNNIANTVGQIMSSKPHVEHSGSFSGNTGYLGVRRPYLIITRPNQCMPNQYQQFNGFPSMISQELSTLSGFTKVQQVQLTGMTATNPEQAEILEFLKSGVIL